MAMDVFLLMIWVLARYAVVKIIEYLLYEFAIQKITLSDHFALPLALCNIHYRPFNQSHSFGHCSKRVLRQIRNVQRSVSLLFVLAPW